MTTLIIGGGLSGLALAEMLENEGHDYKILEARNRFGGRILTERIGDGYFDMGPAWFWPGQPRIAALIDRLGLQQFDQYAAGDLAFEDEHGRVKRGRGFSSMQGSWRLEGGLATLTQTLADNILGARKHLNAAVERIEWSDDRCVTKLSDGTSFAADKIVLAMPPRLASELEFCPPLSAKAMDTMQSVATWMAGQAKAVAVYDTPFWRDAGLSGDAMSRHGPMVEIHDASPKDGAPYALFGFIGVSPDARSDLQNLKRALREQLARLFGRQGAEPKKLLIKDWASDPYTATNADAVPQYHHPSYGLPSALQNLCNGRLIFAGTEVARNFGGYIEGALEAAETAFDHICEGATSPK